LAADRGSRNLVENLDFGDAERMPAWGRLCRADPAEDPSRGTSAVNTRQTSAPQVQLAQLCVNLNLSGGRE
jgi:hypothetical protein